MADRANNARKLRELLAFLLPPLALAVALGVPLRTAGQIIPAGESLADYRWNYWSKQLDVNSPTVRSVALSNLTMDKENLDRAYPLISARLDKEERPLSSR